jgi:hypothetical protein
LLFKALFFLSSINLYGMPVALQGEKIGIRLEEKMFWLTLVSILLIVLALLGLRLKASRGHKDEYPYIRNQALFTPAERSLLEVLEQAVGAEYRIFGKIRIVDVVNVRTIEQRSVRQRAFNRINGKHFDFILCAKEDLSIVGAVDLDHRSHQDNKASQRDTFLEGLCQAISLPLVRVQPGRAYSVTELREKVVGALSGRTEATTTDWGEPLDEKISEGQLNGPEVFSGGWTL